MTWRMLPQRREIVSGPQKYDWAMAMIGERIAEMRVRGIFSDCICPQGNECSDCRDSERVHLRLLGTLSINGGRSYIFWGLLARVRADLEELGTTDPCPLTGEVPQLIAPSMTQLVFGQYSYLTHEAIKWIQACPEGMDLESLRRLLYNTDRLMTGSIIVRGNTHMADLELDFLFTAGLRKAGLRLDPTFKEEAGTPPDEIPRRFFLSDHDGLLRLIWTDEQLATAKEHVRFEVC